jgi:hypothetical protein
MKRIFYVLFIAALVAALSMWMMVALQAAQAPFSHSIDALTHAVKAYPAADAGTVLGDLIVARWQGEVAKLVFWIHLFS